MTRPYKIALLGATGYNRNMPQRLDCFSWDNLKTSINLGDYDALVLNLLSAKPNTDWKAFCEILPFSTAFQIGTIIVVGDPRLVFLFKLRVRKPQKPPSCVGQEWCFIGTVAQEILLNWITPIHIGLMESISRI
jgi:hypothetical protein